MKMTEEVVDAVLHLKDRLKRILDDQEIAQFTVSIEYVANPHGAELLFNKFVHK